MREGSTSEATASGTRSSAPNAAPQGGAPPRSRKLRRSAEPHSRHLSVSAPTATSRSAGTAVVVSNGYPRSCQRFPSERDGPR